MDPEALKPRTLSYQFTVFNPSRVQAATYAPRSSVTNLSTRAVVGSGEEVLISGLIVEGKEPIRVAFRAQGPGLAAYGISKTAKDPKMELYQVTDFATGESEKLGSVDDWRQSANWRLIESFSLSPRQEKEAACVATLMPGRYTAVVSDAEEAGGVGILEVFNVDSASHSEFINLSTRGLIGAGEQAMVAGFVLQQETTVVVRAQGPTLRRYGIQNAAGDLTLRIAPPAQSDLAGNDDWGSDPRNTLLKGDLGWAAPGDATEAALVLTLPAGAYTAIAETKNGQPGIGIVEVFKIQTPP
jgi:hypothetical protein